MNEIVEKALPLWGMAGAEYHLIAARENAVYQVMTDKGSCALRLHRQGYRSDRELWSELKWMDAVAAGGIKVPAPIASTSDAVLHVVDGVQVDVLTWLSGAPVSSTFATLSETERATVFFQLGQEMARLHTISDAWAQPEGFTRCAWNRDGLLGENPLWDRFWENPALSASDQPLFTALRQRANAELAAIENELDYGLIHADLVRENIMVDGDSLQLIDFDDGGFGFRVFDIATALLKNMGERDFETIKTMLIDGYTSVRSINLETLDLFLVLRSATYVGWNITRMQEDGAALRNERFVSTTRRLAQAHLVDLCTSSIASLPTHHSP